MDEVSPSRFGLSHGRYANIRSLVLKALKLAGVAALPSRHISRLSPEWQQLYNLSAKTAATSEPLTLHASLL